MHEVLIDLPRVNAEIHDTPSTSVIDRLKNANEKIAPVTAVVSMFLIIEGWTRKDWNQIAVGLGLAVPSYYGLGDCKNENNANLDNNSTEVEIYNNQVPSS